MSVEEIQRATERGCIEGNGWPPSLSQFIELGNQKIDYEEAFARMMIKQPEGRVEQFVYENHAFNLRRMSQNEAERTHKREMNKAMQLDKLGKLELNSERVLSLPPNSVKNTNDIAREEFENKNQGKLNPRIQAIINSRKES